MFDASELDLAQYLHHSFKNMQMNIHWTANVNRDVFVPLLLLIIGIPFYGSIQTKKEQNMTTISGNSTELFQPVAVAASDDEAAIRSLEERFAAAFNAGDIDAMMKNYIPDQSLVVFDVVPPRQHSGVDEYRKAWVGFFAHFRNIPKIAINDLGITVNSNLGFSHSIQHVMGTDTQGHLIDRTVRVTDGYRKIGGNWLIVLEHVSVPVDLKTGKPDFTSKP
jgi:ketosteroid isomerase-like protein